MPRHARLDAPGTLHHIIGGGIAGTKIFETGKDREDLLRRVAGLCETGAMAVYAGALMDAHFHLLAGAGRQTLSPGMRKLLTGFVVNFNKRHGRCGRLFQNRYKSIACEDDPYLSELTRYIHLNPARAGIVKDISELDLYPWTGHSVLMGKVSRVWQDKEAVLACFGATAGYREFVAAGLMMGPRHDLRGGG
jgi:putative transposase